MPPREVSASTDTLLELEDEPTRGLTLENQELRGKAAFLHRLLMATTLLTRHRALVSGDLAGALLDFTRTTSLSVEVQRASIWFLDEARTQLTCACIFDGLEGLHGKGARLSASRYPAYFSAIERSRVVAAEDALADPRTCELAQGYLIPLNISSILDVPIKVGDRLIGVVCLEHTGPIRAWQPEDQQFAAFVSSLVSLVIETSERIKKLEVGRQGQPPAAAPALAK